MKKSTLIGISILSVFLLCSLSYNPIIAEDNNIELSKGDEIWWIIFFIGKIDGYSTYNYSAGYLNLTLYTFNCKNVLFILWHRFEDNEIYTIKNGVYTSMNGRIAFEFYEVTKGYFSDNFICGYDYLYAF